METTVTNRHRGRVGAVLAPQPERPYLRKRKGKEKGLVFRVGKYNSHSHSCCLKMSGIKISREVHTRDTVVIPGKVVVATRSCL